MILLFIDVYLDKIIICKKMCIKIPYRYSFNTFSGAILAAFPARKRLDFITRISYVQTSPCFLELNATALLFYKANQGGVIMDQQYYIKLEDELGAHNYKPLDVVLHRGEGVWVWDVEGNKYMTALRLIQRSIRGIVIRRSCVR